jgi:peptidoglycan hydrolase CwlO-like protein
MKDRIIFASIIFATVLVISLYRIISKADENDVRVQAMQKKYNELKISNDSLNVQINSEIKKVVEYKKQIDSLQGVKQKIKYVYETKYKEITNSDASGVNNMLKSIFTINGVK